MAAHPSLAKKIRISSRPVNSFLEARVCYFAELPFLTTCKLTLLETNYPAPIHDHLWLHILRIDSHMVLSSAANPVDSVLMTSPFSYLLLPPTSLTLF